MSFSHKDKHTLKPYNLAMPVPGIYPEKFKTYAQTKTYIQIFVIALTIIAKILEISTLFFNTRIDELYTIMMN